MEQSLRDEYMQKAFKLHNANYVSEAELLYKKIIKENPYDSETYNLMAICKLQENKFDEAEDLTLKAISFSPKRYYYQTLASIYKYKNNIQKEIDTLLEEEKFFGLNYELAFSLGLAYKNFSNFVLAEKYYIRALDLTDNKKDIYFNMGNLYKMWKQFDRAKDAYQKCLDIDKNDREAKYSLSLIHMQQKDYKNGLNYFESRLCRETAIRTEEKTYPNLISEQNIWRGENISDKVLYTYYEAGFGDMIMFARYIPILEKLCKKLIIKPQVELYELFKVNFPNSQVMKYFCDEKQFHFDVHIPFLSIPYALNYDENKIFTSADKQYIFAEKDKSDYYRNNHFNNDKFKIGIKWQGNTYYDIDRVIDVNAFGELFNLPNTQIYSYQTFEGSEELAKIKNTGNIIDLSDSLKDFSYTAAAIANTDLIICNDTSLAHIAGAMKKRCIVLLPNNYNWRWHMDISKCDWYDTVQLYKLEENETWAELMNRVIKDLKLS